MITFRQKDFSNYIVSDALKGAKIGAAVGTTIGGVGIKKLPKFIPGADKYNNMRHTETVTFKKDNKEQTKSTEIGRADQGLMIMGASTILGAALGALVGTVREIDKKISRLGADNRLMTKITSDLESVGYKEGKDYVRDTKMADRLKTKVCIVLTKDAADFRILINLVEDARLKQVADKTLRGLSGNAQVRHNTASNRYNEISISTISNASNNAKTVSEIAKGFIKAGYPVYLVEVG